jgi:hypothetical protein
MSQRGALNLSPDGRLLYVPFGAYGDGGAGWMVAVDTQAARLASAFAGAPSVVAFANGGMWASAGPAIDANGIVYATTGNGTTANETTPGYWSQSVLQWQSGSPLTLIGTYTPFNYCQMDQYDTDLGGGAPIIIPDLGSANTSTPHLLAFGGKQGNMYLLDRDHMPGSLVVRPGCSTNSTTDRSLLPPVGQPQFNGAIGPLNIFGPYSEEYTNVDYAKSRATPAYFQGADGTNYLFATGSTKQAVSSQSTVPPCVVRLKIVINPGKPAYLSEDRTQNSMTMLSPGSPLVTSNGSSNAIVWVLVGNVTRSQNLLDPNAAHPILYAFDQNLNILWNSTEDQLNASGKYMIPAIARGTVFVGTDRIQAFGLTAGSSGGTEIAISSGGGQAGIFSADMDYTEGHADTFQNPVDTSTVQNPAPEAVYQSKRTGGNNVGFSYVIPGLRPGNAYKLRLHFAESVASAPGGRVFNVAVNGTVVLPNFDIYQVANGEFRAVIKEFMTTSDANGKITITYSYGVAGNPLSSGLEIIPIANGVAIDSGGPAAGTFLADTDFVGGHADTFSNSVDTSAVSNPAPAVVYQSKRTGNGSGQGFTYNIANLTTGHTYIVRLHFVESAWMAAGQRVFNVAINGNTVLSNFDIFAAAGGEFKATVRQFSVIPDSTGTISIVYQYGSAGNPLASGIEVIP